MATISNVKYLNEEIIYNYLHDPNETYLEGFIADEEPASYYPYSENGVYIKLFKVPVNSKATQLYLQEFHWRAWEGGYNAPLPEDGRIGFEQAGFIANSSEFWIYDNCLLSVYPKLNKEQTYFRDDFEEAFCTKIIKEYKVYRDEDEAGRKEINKRAKQYAIYAMLAKKPVYRDFIISDANDILHYTVKCGFGSVANYILDKDDYLDDTLKSLSRCCQGFDRCQDMFPIKVAAARLADKIGSTYISDDNESQRIAESLCAYCADLLDKRSKINVVIGTGSDDDIHAKVSCETLLHYEPTSKEVFVNVKSASKNEREKINQYVKDNGTFVSEDLVPMSLLQSVVSYGWEYWNRDFPE